MLTRVLLALSCHGDMARMQMPEQSPAPAGDSSWNFPATSKAQAMAQAQVLSTTLGVPVSTDPSKPPPVGSSTNVSAAVTNKVRAHMIVSIHACAVLMYVLHSAPPGVQSSQASRPLLPQALWFPNRCTWLSMPMLRSPAEAEGHVC